ncbi:MAG: LacI family DNA-binding transcriptional regulator [Gammaproteobacteria bacterium]|nr:LacI family DNA-binding transcriptional regulator [Gammaproteobacteria bacterium]
MKPARAVTMDDIARLAKVSKPTVSRALSNSPLVKDATREHVLEIARKHGYAVNRNAQKLRHKRTNTIAVSLDFRSHKQNHISDPFIFELLAGVAEALGDLNQDLLLCAPDHNNADAFQQMLLSRGADGFIVLGQGHRENMLEAFAASGAPLVVWGAAGEHTGYCVVGSDNYLGGQLAGDYFIRKNRKRFLFFGDTSFREIQLRHDGLQQVVANSGNEIEIDTLTLSNFSYEAAFNAATNYLGKRRSPPDAVFAFSDTAAMAFVCAFRDAGIEAGKEASIVGYNDIPSAAYFNPPVTTIKQDIHQAGKQLVSSLMRLLDGEDAPSSTIHTELIVRDT